MAHGNPNAGNRPLTRRNLLGLSAAGIVTLAAEGFANATASVIAIRADVLYPVSGPPVKNAVVIIRGGRIASVGAGLTVPAGAKVLHAAAVIPGLVDPHSYLGVYGQNSEPVDAITPDFQTVDAFTSEDRHVLAAAAAGITTAIVAPGNSGVLAGKAGLIHLGSATEIVSSYAAQKISISADAASADKNPTSRAGAAALFGKALTAAKSGLGVSSTTQSTPLIGVPTGLSQRAEALLPLLSRKVSGIFHAPGADDAEIAIELIAKFGLRGVLLHTADAYRMASTIAKAGVGIVLSPLSITDSDRTLGNAAKLSAAGVKVSFCSDAPLTAPDSLRRSACLAVQFGLPEAVALAAITQTAAQHAGAAGFAGTIAPGLPADMVLLNGDPLDYSTRIEGVLSRGKLVTGGSAHAS